MNTIDRRSVSLRWRAARHGCLALLLLSAAAAAEPRAHTFSIVARDPATGNLGVAVQSHWFQVGAVVPWAESGVGAVATQSFVRMDYGPLGLALMRSGKTAQQALDSLLATDPEKDVRQVAMVDAAGNVAAWTGPKCIRAAGDAQGKAFSTQANLMDQATVWPAMARAYESSTGDFADRLLAALDAAQSAGGDIRGRQSAALLIVRGSSTGRPWDDRLVDLRVDDAAEPIVELRRLVTLHRAYDEMNQGDAAAAVADWDAAVGHYSTAAKMAPEIAELPFWQAATLFMAGKEDEAMPIFKDVFAREERWARLVPRLPASGLLPDDPKKIAKILSVAPK